MSELITDIATFTPLAILVCILFHLSRRETKKSLEQSNASNKLLSSKLMEQAEALRESELARVHELTKAAEFGRLAQGLFHDLMTPLTSIILHTEELKKNNATQSHLEKAIEASHRMTRYMHDIRTSLAQEEMERMCNVKEELENILHLLAYQIKSAGILLTVKSPQEKIQWFGNPVKIRQVFLNLISNSIDSFEKNSRDIRKIEIEISPVQNISITVSDNGCGMSPETVQKVFYPFFTTKEIHKGTGIGLTTVKTIVEKYLKGTIELTSEEGRGTEVQISFPVRFS